MSNLPLLLVQDLERRFGELALTRVAPGFSGAVVFRGDFANAPSVAVKRLPAGYRVARLGEIHETISQIRSAGFDHFPSPVGNLARIGDGWIRLNEFLWEVNQWTSGECLPIEAERRQIFDGIRFLARFHRASASVGTQHQVPPAVVQRCERFLAHNGQFASPSQAAFLARRFAQRHRLSSDSWDASISDCMARELTEILQILHLHWPQVANAANEHLGRWRRPLLNLFSLRDIHREHMLFVAGEPTSLIDFDAMRVDTPVTDLVRWMGSLRGWNRTPIQRPDPVLSYWRQGVAEYQAECSWMDSQPEENWLDLAITLHFCGVWLALDSWVRWIAEPRFFAAGPPAVLGRIIQQKRAAMDSLALLD